MVLQPFKLKPIYVFKTSKCFVVPSHEVSWIKENKVEIIEERRKLNDNQPN